MNGMFSTANMARSSAAHPWRTIAIWIVIIVLSIATMGILGDQTTTEINFTDDPESQVGLNLLTDAGLADKNPTDETLIVHAESGTVDDAAYQTKVEEITNALRNMPGIVVPETVTNFYELNSNEATAAIAPGLVSENRQTTLIPLTLTGDLDDATKNAPTYLDDIEALGGDGFELTSVGYVSIGEENNAIAEEDLIQGETIGIIAAMIILVIVFAALVAAGIPIILAVVSIIVAFGITTLIGSVWELSFFVTNMITMIGLAVGIDYTLFVVERYREERRQGRAKPDAIGIAGSTASKAVAFSGATVVLALLGMLLLPNSIFKALGIGAIAVVVVSVFATLTLIPAVISLLGDKIDWPRKRNYENYSATHALANPHSLEAAHSGFWGRVTRAVTARPIISAVAAVVLLLACAIPYLDINTGFAGVETMPEDSHVRQGFEILSDEFSAGRISPVQIAIDGDQASAQPGIDKLVAALGTETVPDGDATRPAFVPIDSANAVRWNEGGTVGLLEVTLNISSNEDRAYSEIKHLRSDLIPAAFEGTGAEVYVTGDTAFNQDFFDQVETYTPYVLIFVLGLSFILLLLAFRSVVVSATAIVMNLLSVGAAYGLLVLVFQKGIGDDVLGFQQTPTIEAWIPLFLFCVLFGLSMDYHVFLLSRIREHYDLTGKNTESVAVGLHSTAKIITGAALIMVAVFGGFAAGRLVMLQQMGFGLGVAVLLDATVVRSVLVPSVMSLLGNRNWYMPNWLKWLPDLRIEGAPAEPHPQQNRLDGVAVSGAPAGGE